VGWGRTEGGGYILTLRGRLSDPRLQTAEIAASPSTWGREIGDGNGAKANVDKGKGGPVFSEAS